MTSYRNIFSGQVLRELEITENYTKIYDDISFQNDVSTNN